MEINREEGEEGKIETSYARFELRPRYIPYIDADLINKFTVVFFFFFFKCKKKKHDEIHLRKITWMDKKKGGCNNYDRIPPWCGISATIGRHFVSSIRIVKQPRPRSAYYTCRAWNDSWKRSRILNHLITDTLHLSHARPVVRYLLERYELRLYIKLRSAFVVPTLRFFARSLFFVFFFFFFNSSVSKIEVDASVDSDIDAFLLYR